MKLPIVGERVDVAVDRPAAIPRTARRVVLVVGAVEPNDGLHAARALRDALHVAGARVGEVATTPEALVAGDASEWVVAAGAELAFACDPMFAIAITRGLGPASWTKAARSIRDRIDVEIAGDRESLLPAIARDLASG